MLIFRQKDLQFPCVISRELRKDVSVFQVMRQKHNRHVSISLYISALAVTDSIALLIGKFKLSSLPSIYGHYPRVRVGNNFIPVCLCSRSVCLSLCLFVQDITIFSRHDETSWAYDVKFDYKGHVV